MIRKVIKLSSGFGSLVIFGSAVISSAAAQAPLVQPALEVPLHQTESYQELSPEDLLREIDEPSKVVHLTVIVHDKALVTINGEPTYTKGTVRHYIARKVQPGKTYVFNIEALVKNEQGAEFTATESVSIDAGGNKQVVLKVRRSKRQPVPAQSAVPAQPTSVNPSQSTQNR
jgi:uncharacterized protein (TIGR03000 family)